LDRLTISTRIQEALLAAAPAISAPAAGRKVPCEKCPLRGKEVLRDFTAKELPFIAEFKSGELNVQAGTNILLQGTNSAHLYTVLSGWAFRYKTLADGRRQILNYAVPGDLLGLQGSVADEMQHSVEALTDMILCVFPREKLWDLYSGYPALAFDITWLAAREEQMLDENLLNVGRRTAVERAAYLLLHLFTRAEEIGLVKGNTVALPFTQQHVADTLGMSLVHTNKTLKRLAATRTVRWKDRTLELLDREGLVRIARYEAPAQRAKRPFI
jgi:CRP/FNR family transcriptional regulator